SFRGIRFLGAGASVDANFPNGSGIGIRRTHLHQALLDRAHQMGVALWWGTQVRGVSGDGVILDNGVVPCRWIVGSDGERSRVRQWAGLDSLLHESVRFGFRRHYQLEPWTDCMEIYWGSHYQIYVTPVGSEAVCVAVISRNSHLRIDSVLRDFPELDRKLAGAPILST